MKTCLCALALASLLGTAPTILFAAEDSKNEAIQRDRQKIAGTWQVTSVEINGSKAADEDVKRLKVVNGTDGTWTLLDEQTEIAKGTSTFDPTKSPKTIDFAVTEGGGKGEHYVGIYELGENSRKMCFAPPGNDRPTEFSSPPASKYILVTFEREKKP